MSQPPQDWQGQPGKYGPPGEAGQPGPSYGGYSAQPYGSGPDPYGPPVKPSGKATTSLVLGVASMVVFCLGFVLGIPAIVVGMKARKDIRLAQGRLTGDGLALGGIITGIIGTLLGLAVTALIISVVAVGSSVGGLGDEVCEQLAQDNDPSNDCT